MNKKKPFSVPFTQGEKSRIFVEGQIVSTNFQFLLDSGAQVIWMNSKKLSDIPLTEIPASSQSLVGTPFEFKVSLVDEVLVNSIPFKKVMIHISESQSTPLMPLTLFEASRIEIDFDTQVIKFNSSEGHHCEPETRFAVNHNKQILLPLRYLNNERVWFVFDTGADRGIIKNSARPIFARDLVITGQTKVTSPYLAEEFSAPLARLNQTTFLGQNLEQEFAVVDLQMHYLVENSFIGLVGLDFITKYNWHFDFQEMKFCAVKRK